MSAYFDVIQTFYVNPDAVNKATEIMLTSLDLFFRSKPSLSTNISGSSSPGVSVWICEVASNTSSPNAELVLKNSIVTVPYDGINTSQNAMTATTVAFSDSVILQSGKYYGIVVKYSDPSFTMWINKQGDGLISSSGETHNASLGAQATDIGNYYTGTSSNSTTPYSDRDLKFAVKIAKFTSGSSSTMSQTYNLVNKDYEFFTITNNTGAFQGGEWVYQDVVNSTGTITISSTSKTIVGIGTTFTAHSLDQSIVVSNGSYTDVLKISQISNTTSIIVKDFPVITGTFNYKVPVMGKAKYINYSKQNLYLIDSTAANSNFSFKTTSGNKIIGVRSGAQSEVSSIDNYFVDHFSPHFSIANPSSAKYTVTNKFVNDSGVISTDGVFTDLFKNNNLPYKAKILSRSTEVVTSGLYSSGSYNGKKKKSTLSTVSVETTTANTFQVSYINSEELDLFLYTNDINNVYKADKTFYNTYTAANYTVTNFDTEILKNGLASSKYISKKVAFAADKFAEDIVVYMSAYRPAGSEIRVYAKILNSIDTETFDDKAWTPLEIKDNLERYSTSNTDIVEYTYGFSQYPEVSSTLSGNFTVQSTNNLIGTSADVSSSVSTSDLIRVYDPLISDNHEVFAVLASNSSTITVNKPITNVNIIGNMSVDKLKYKNNAWNNIANDNVVRYVSNGLTEFDYYNSMQIKIVLLSDNSYDVPSVEQIQVIGVSA
jgi:hypothetical protein